MPWGRRKRLVHRFMRKRHAEWLIVILLDEINGIITQQVSHIPLHFLLPAVDVKHRVDIHALPLKADPMIVAAPRPGMRSHVKFADMSRQITGLLQQLGIDRRYIRIVFSAVIVDHTVGVCVCAGQERGA